MVGAHHHRRRSANRGSDRTLIGQRVLRLIQAHCDGEQMVKLQASPKGMDYFKAARLVMGLV